MKTERNNPRPSQEATPHKTEEEYSVASDSSPSSKLFIWFFLILLVYSFYLFYQIVAPFIHSIILAAIFSALLYPLYLRVFRLLKNRAIPSALVILLLTAIFVLVPVVTCIIGLIPQATSSITAINQWLAGQHPTELLAEYLNPALVWIDSHFPELNVSQLDVQNSLLSLSRSTGRYILTYGTSFLNITVTLLMHFALILLLMFYFLLNGREVLQRVEYLSPLKPHQTAIVIESMRRITRSVFVGGLLVAILQGIAGGIGLAIVGLPGLFWGTVMAFAALVPIVGTGLVWVPCALYLFLSGETGLTIFLLIWCGAGVSSIDTVLRPFLLRDGAKVPVLFLFLAILGGVQAFGMLGLLYGPMILGLVAVMLTIYAEEYHSILVNRH